MKHTALLLLIALFTLGISAQDVTTIEAASADISDNLDLEAVASVFADAENLEDFERQLNDPELRINNLDINQDGYVDYLRVIELAEANARLITIQAVLGKDLYQDVASIDVERDDNGRTRVQVVGDVYMYGDNYIVEPVYRYRPVIFTYLWAPRFQPWCSAYSWGYYPSYWTLWAPFSFNIYWGHVSHYHGYHNYYYRPYRYSNTCGNLYYGHRRNDYGRVHPHRAFAARHSDFKNKRELNVQTRPADRVSRSARAGVTADARPMNERGAAKPYTVSARPASKEGLAMAKHPSQRVTTSKGDRFATADRPQTVVRPIASTKPNTAKPRVEMRPSSQTRPAPKPQVNQRPSAKPQATTRPRTETRSIATPKPRVDTRPQMSTRPQSSKRSQSSTRPSQSSRHKSKAQSKSSRKPSSAASRASSKNRSQSSAGSRSSSRPSSSGMSRPSGGSSKSKSSSGSRR